MAVKITGLKIKETFDALIDAAIQGANNIMDEHVVGARQLCPSRKGVSIGTQYRKPYGDAKGYKFYDVLFKPGKGRNKGKVVNFIAKTQTGRVAGELKATIRKVSRYDRPSNIRVYAGTRDVFWARFTEYGTASTGWGKGVPRQSFLRPSFQAIKPKVQEAIESEMRKHPEVK